MSMQGKQILARAIEIQTEKIGVTTHFLEITEATTIILKNSKIQSNVWHFVFHIEANLLPLKKAWLPLTFFLDTKSTLSFAFSA